jgi:tetratricopeptide (TPR) repeat protein
MALLQAGRVDEAVAHFKQVSETQFDDAEAYAMAHNNLGNILLQKGQADEAIAHFQKVLEIADFAETHNNLGVVLAQRGRAREAIAHYEKSLEIQPDNSRTLSNLAWVLAACPEASIRNGAKAIELAQRANQMSGGQDPLILRTLAAAYAEGGRFAEAIAAARQALELAAAQNNTALENALRGQIGLYQRDYPFRDSNLTDVPAYPKQP